MFQQMLGGKTAQMLRLRLDDNMPCVPEISANKYVLNIRFMAQNGGSAGAHLGADSRARTADWDVGFELTFCNL
jgi:cell division protein ZapD